MRLALRRHLTLGVAAALVAAAALVGMAATAHAAGPSATFVKTSDWGNGWEGKYTINGGDTGLSSWKVEFDLPAGTTISSHWDAVRSGTTATHPIFSNTSWNGLVAANTSVSFGVIGTGAGSPTNCTINGASCGGAVVTKPGTPGTPTVTSVTSSSISLSWAAASGTVTGYRVYEGTTVAATVTGTTATISGLAAKSTHTYTVAAYNSAGESAKSAGVIGTTSDVGQSVPGAVPNFRASAVTDTTITLAWDAPTGTVTGYRIYKSDATPWATTSNRTHTATGLGTCSTHTFNISAYNSVGEGPRTTTLSVTTTGCGGGGSLPKHFLTGYWHNFDNPARELRLREVPLQYDVVAVAFAESTASQGAITFGVDAGLSASLGGYTNANFKADVSTLHSRGQKVILSVGGERGTIAVNDSASATRFADTATAIIRDFGFDGIDIDLENGVNATYMGSALRTIRNSVGTGANFIITMAPQTIDMQSAQMEYFKLALNIKDILTVVHTQYYNSGGMLGCDQNAAYFQGTVNFLTALACIQLEGGLRPDQVALGLPSGAGAAGGGVVAPSVVNDALNCLARGTNCGSFKPPHTYPGIRGAMTWSINWDVTNGGGFANTVGPFVDTLP